MYMFFMYRIFCNFLIDACAAAHDCKQWQFELIKLIAQRWNFRAPSPSSGCSSFWTSYHIVDKVAFGFCFDIFTHLIVGVCCPFNRLSVCCCCWFCYATVRYCLDTNAQTTYRTHASMPASIVKCIHGWKKLWNRDLVGGCCYCCCSCCCWCCCCLPSLNTFNINFYINRIQCIFSETRALARVHFINTALYFDALRCAYAEYRTRCSYMFVCIRRT